MWVFDTTPLIYLAKVDRLILVEHLETTCIIPERIYEEVAETGLEQGYPDARRIERSVDADRFDIVSVDAMIDEGWYCSPDVYAKIIQILESFAD